MGSKVRAVLLIVINIACAAYVNVVACRCTETVPCPPSSNDRPEPRYGGTIEGKVFQLTGKDSGQKPYFGFRIQAVELDSQEVKAMDITDESGCFRLQVPAGRYRIEPQGFEFLKIAGSSEADTLEVNVEDAKSIFRTLRVTNNSVVSGIVFDEDGKKITSWHSVQLISVGKNDGEPGFESYDPPRFSGGGFRFDRIPPGRYHLSFNYRHGPSEDMPYPTWFYPGTSDRAKATVFRIEEGTTTPPLIFKLPPKLHEISLSGLVVWKDGRPATGVEVQLIDLESNRGIFDKLLTDTNGHFSAESFPDRRYKIKVVLWEKAADGIYYEVASAETEEFVLGISTPAFRIELQSVEPGRKWRRQSTGVN